MATEDEGRSWNGSERFTARRSDLTGLIVFGRVARSGLLEARESLGGAIPARPSMILSTNDRLVAILDRWISFPGKTNPVNEQDGISTSGTGRLKANVALS
jgi:hypothetical protein